MAFLFFTCPNTQRRAPTSITLDLESLRARWSESFKVQCSLCGELHEMSVRETYVDNALHDATDRLRHVI